MQEITELESYWAHTSEEKTKLGFVFEPRVERRRIYVLV